MKKGIKGYFFYITSIDTDIKYNILCWFAAFISILYFDILWCTETSYVPLFTSRFLYVTAIVFATILIFPSFFLKNRLWQVILLLSVNFLFEANIMYCRTYCSAIPISSYLLIGNLTDFKESIIDSYRWYDTFLLILPFSIFLYRIKVKTIVLKYKLQYIIILTSLTLIESLMFLTNGGYIKTIEKVYSNANTSYMVVPKFSILSFIAYDYIVSQHDISKDEIKHIKTWIKEHNTYTDSYLKSCATDTSINENQLSIVYIICESLESWPIGLKVEDKEITPFLNSLVSDSTNYYNPNVVTQVKGGRSIDCQLLTLSGLFPINSGSYSFKYYDSLKRSVPDALKKQGTKCYMFSCDNRYVWNQASVATSLCIDSLYTRETWDLSVDESVNPVDGNMTDAALFTQAVDRFKHDHDIWPVNSPLMSIWVTRSGHNPFKLDKKLDNLKLHGRYNNILKDYLTATNYVDSSLKILFDYLRERDDWNNIIVVITGDHEGLAGHRKAIVDESNTDFVSSGEFTPLIVVNSSKLHGRDSKIMGQIDIYPTILDIMGIYSSYQWKGMGFSVLDNSRPGFAFDSHGRIIGNTDDTDNAIVDHCERAMDISDAIIRYDLLNQLVE